MKYKVSDLLDKTIAITNYEKERSTKHAGTYYYKLQFVFRDAMGETRLGFTTCGAKQVVQVLDGNPAVPLYRTFTQRGRSICFKENIASLEETIDRLRETLNLDYSKLT